MIEVEALVQILQQSSIMRFGFQANSLEFAANRYFIVVEGPVKTLLLEFCMKLYSRKNYLH